MKKADLLKSALEIVEKRGLTYGTPENNFARIAALWTTYLTDRRSMVDGSMTITETDVAAMMVLMKIARLMEKPDHLDSWLDLAGYAACGAEVSGAGDTDPEPEKSYDQLSQKTFDFFAQREEAFQKAKAAKFKSVGDPGPWRPEVLIPKGAKLQIRHRSAFRTAYPILATVTEDLLENSYGLTARVEGQPVDSFFPGSDYLWKLAP